MRRMIFLFCMLSLQHLSGQNTDQRLDEGSASFKERIAIRTNVVDWVLTTPNIAFDYDVVNTPYDKKSVGIAFKYNWNTTHTYIPKQVYNLFDLRLDYRFYWRQQPYDERPAYGDWERGWLKSAKGIDKLRARISCFRGAETPKLDVSFFVGPYLSGSTFSIKLNPADKALGKQGVVWGGGLTGGVAMPLYGYENGSALDLEIGGSVGWHFASFNLYSVDVESNCYHMQGHHNKWTWYPLLTDARVALVYRFRTIAKQHNEINYNLLDRRYIELLMERDKAVVKEYNASIKEDKSKIDKYNQEIAHYKQTVEVDSAFNAAYSLEYLIPYAYMMEAPRKYTRHNKDTLPKIEINSIEQIADRILLSMREEIDSIPGVTSAQIDDEFIKQYNNLSAQDGKTSVNRTELVNNIYKQLNTYYIKDNNTNLSSSSFVTRPHSEDVLKFNVGTQARAPITITYKDSVRAVEMHHNEKVKWRNNIKKRAWIDEQNRMKGVYIGRTRTTDLIETIVGDSIVRDSVSINSIKIDSTIVNSITDSIGTDSVKVDNIVIDSIGTDSVKIDSIIIDSIRTNSVKVDNIVIDSIGTDGVKIDNIAPDTIATALLNSSILYHELLALPKEYFISLREDEE